MNRLRIHEQAMRLRQIEIDDRRRQLDQIEKMIGDFNRMVVNLDHEIEAEHRRTGIYDSMNVAYSTFARAAVRRRDNIQKSVADLKRQLTRSADALQQAEADLAEVRKRIDLDRALNDCVLASN